MLSLTPIGGAAHGPSIPSLQADDAGLAAKSRAAVLGLYSLDAQLAGARARLDDLQAAQARLAAERAALRQAIHLARVDTRLSQNRLATRLRFLYEHGTVSSLDVLMGASSLEDALNQLDEFNRVAQANADVLVQVQMARRRQRTLQRTIGTRTHALAETTAAAAQTVTQLEQLRGDRVDYIASLESRRSYDASQIARLTAESQAAVVRSQALATQRAATVAAPLPSPDPAPAPAPAAVAGGGRTLTVVATAYDLPGHTSTGLPVGWGIAAVDPSVIPLGTRIVVPGYGVAVAADTGGAIVGDTIDLWFPSAEQAYAWGRRTVTISVGA
jgi:3D (Asp-Asp-Asp) domain-containing protein